MDTVHVLGVDAVLLLQGPTRDPVDNLPPQVVVHKRRDSRNPIVLEKVFTDDAPVRLHLLEPVDEHGFVEHGYGTRERFMAKKPNSCMVLINDSYKLIFVENPKSGSTSIRQALLDIFKWSRIRSRPSDAHLTCQQIRDTCPEKWATYLKVTTYREPFARFCSSVNFKNHWQFNTYSTPEQYVNHRRNFKRCVYCLPQEAFTEGCDVILRVDTLQADFDALCERIGVPTVQLDKKNEARDEPLFSKEILEKLFKE